MTRGGLEALKGWVLAQGLRFGCEEFWSFHLTFSQIVALKRVGEIFRKGKEIDSFNQILTISGNCFILNGHEIVVNNKHNILFSKTEQNSVGIVLLGSKWTVFWGQWLLGASRTQTGLQAPLCHPSACYCQSSPGPGRELSFLSSCLYVCDGGCAAL